MTEENLFLFSFILYSIVLSAFGITVYKTNENNIHSREKACREKINGSLMAFAALFWCAKHGQSIFPGAKIANYFIPLAFVFTWLSYFLLDFLATRSFAALLILFAHYHLYWIFAIDPPFAPIASLLCFITGTAGIIIAGKPCLLRDFFRKSAQDPLFKRYSVISIFIISFMYLFTGICIIINKSNASP